MRTVILASLLIAALSGPASACFEDVPVTAQLVADAANSDFVHAPAGEHSPEILVGYLSYLRDAALEPAEGADVFYGTVVFVRDGADWRASMPVNGESALGVYVESNGPGSVLVTQLQIEGPGQSFTVARSDDGFRSGTCAVIDFPSALNDPGWMMETLGLDGFGLDARGRGSIAASGEIDTDTDHPRVRHWRYDTRDGGRSWSGPRPLSRAVRVKPGAFVPVDSAAPEAALASLKAYASGR